MFPSQRIISRIGNKLPRSKRFGDNEMNQELPPGFHDILTMITREVIMHKPLNVYEFCATVTEHELDKRIIMELSTPVKIGLEENKSEVSKVTKEHLLSREQWEDKEIKQTMLKEVMCESVVCEPNQEYYLTEDTLKITKPEEKEVLELFVEEDIIKQHVIPNHFSSYSLLKITAHEKENESVVKMQDEESTSSEDFLKDHMETDLADRVAYMDQILCSAKLKENMPHGMKPSAVTDTQNNINNTKNATDLNYLKYDLIDIGSDLDPENQYILAAESISKNLMTGDMKLAQVYDAQQDLSVTENITEADFVSDYNVEQKHSDLNNAEQDAAITDVCLVATILNGGGEEVSITDTEKYDTVHSENIHAKQVINSASQSSNIYETDSRQTQTELTWKHLDSAKRADTVDKKTAIATIEKHVTNYVKDQDANHSEIIDSQEHIFSNSTYEDSLCEIDSMSEFDVTDKQTDFNSWESNLGEENGHQDMTEEFDDTDNQHDLNSNQGPVEVAVLESVCMSESSFSQKPTDLNSSESNLNDENVQRDEPEQYAAIDDRRDIEWTQSLTDDAIMENACIREGNSSQKQPDLNNSESDLDEENIQEQYTIRVEQQDVDIHQDIKEGTVFESSYMSEATLNQKQRNLSSSEPDLRKSSMQNGMTEHYFQQNVNTSKKAIEDIIAQKNHMTENTFDDNECILMNTNTGNHDAEEIKINDTANYMKLYSSDETEQELSITKYSTDDSLSEISFKSDLNDMETGTERNVYLEKNKASTDVEETLSIKARDCVSEQYEFSNGEQDQNIDDVLTEDTVSKCIMTATHCADANIINDCLSENNVRQNETMFLSTPMVKDDVEDSMPSDAAYGDEKLYVSYDNGQELSDNKHSTEDSLSECEHTYESEFKQKQSNSNNLEPDTERVMYSDKTPPSAEHDCEQRECSDIWQEQNTANDKREVAISDNDYFSPSIIIATHCGDAGDVLNAQCNNDLLQEMSNAGAMTKHEVPSKEHYYRALTLYEEIIQYIEHVIAAAIEYIVAESHVAHEEQSPEEKNITK